MTDDGKQPKKGKPGRGTQRDDFKKTTRDALARAPIRNPNHAAASRLYTAAVRRKSKSFFLVPRYLARGP